MLAKLGAFGGSCQPLKKAYLVVIAIKPRYLRDTIVHSGGQHSNL
jgi:hypothetical protein